MTTQQVVLLRSVLDSTRGCKINEGGSIGGAAAPVRGPPASQGPLMTPDYVFYTDKAIEFYPSWQNLVWDCTVQPGVVVVVLEERTPAHTSASAKIFRPERTTF